MGHIRFTPILSISVTASIGLLWLAWNLTRLTGRTISTGGWSERSLPLASVLLTPWALFQGASEEVVSRAKDDGDDDLLDQSGTALEVGGRRIVTEERDEITEIRSRWLSSAVRSVL